MTTFNRRGHWKTNSNGTTFWVGGHNVNRDDWDRYSYSKHKTYQSEETIKYCCFQFSSFVNPNAKCPVCGEDVYYYESPYGGKVYFDSLGPPWPKHSCIDYGVAGTITQESHYKIWSTNIWRPFQVEKIEELENGSYKVTGTVLENGEKEIFCLEDKEKLFSKYYKNLCHVKIQNQHILVSTFEIISPGNNVLELKFHGQLKLQSTESTIGDHEMLKNIWIKMQLSKLSKDFKQLNHLVKYNGVYQIVLEYFSNIYLGIHEEWMQQLMKEHDLPYPETPTVDWFLKLKLEQNILEMEWRRTEVS